MPKLLSWEDLKSYRSEIKGESSLLEPDSGRVLLAVGEATCGIAAGAKEVEAVLAKEIAKRGVNAQIIPTGCFGYCYAEPMVEVRKAGEPSVYYGYVTPEVAKSIVKRHLVEGRILEDNVLHLEVEAE
ncbi:MAG: (2Fe-2S) ferredoxin domain-containing protein [Clostridiales bacterium]|jgi:(2Fe-2S) ferredoxin|nr:(2Fe-2S) ferredoxin domain-containing protein [Clostridiales bacterium]